jgi:hypothetical protein
MMVMMPLSRLALVAQSSVEDEPIPKRRLSQRQHALLELLMSERTYLADLRVLVNVRVCVVTTLAIVC